MDDVIVAVRKTIRCDEQVLFLIAESGNELVSFGSEEFLHSFDIEDITSVFIDFDVWAVSFGGEGKHQIHGFTGRSGADSGDLLLCEFNFSAI